MKNNVVMGVDIGGTNTVYGFIDHNGKVIEFNQIPTNGISPPINLINTLELSLNRFKKLNPKLKKLKTLIKKKIYTKRLMI